MLNNTLAEVTPGSALVLDSRVAEVDAAQAAMRPLAGFGAGAFACDGAWVGLSGHQLAAGSALPRIRSGFAGIRPVHFGASNVGTGTVSTGTVSTKQLNQMTRIYPVAPGGMGPHPPREPDPV
jgi:hypothetical protein